MALHIIIEITLTIRLKIDIIDIYLLKQQNHDIL